MTLIRLLLVALVLFATADAAIAQGRSMSEEEREEAFERQLRGISEKLALTDSELPAVREILMASRDKRMKLMDDLRAGDNQDRRAMRTRMRAIQQETMTALAEILSEDKMQLYREHVRSQREGRGQGRRQGRVNPQ